VDHGGNPGDAATSAAGGRAPPAGGWGVTAATADSLDRVGNLLVIENDPTDDIRRLGEWLTAAGLQLATVRPHAGEPLPARLDGYAGLVVLGGEQHTYEGESWFPACEALLRAAVADRVPTLAICLGAQLLATAHGGAVGPGGAGPEIGPALVARRDAAETDPLFAPVPFTPDVTQWHRDEITRLPPGAVVLAASTRYPHQAFRVGAAWGLQFHIEADLAMVAQWADRNQELLGQLGLDPDRLRDATAAVMDDLAEVWQPFAARFAAFVRGELALPRPLPLVDR
jgi:GMP synthase-like glutamine amidotransferase